MDLTCVVKGKPSPTLSWRRDPNGDDLSANDEKVESITNQVRATTMKIIVTTAGKEVGDKFYCVATNILGNDTQRYIIRERGRCCLVFNSEKKKRNRETHFAPQSITY